MDAKDYEIVKLLKNGCSFSEIQKIVKVSPNRISKLSKAIKQNSDSNDSDSEIINSGQDKSKEPSKKSRIRHVSRNYMLTINNIDFIKKIIIKATHRRIISQEDSKKALEILFKF